MLIIIPSLELEPITITARNKKKNIIKKRLILLIILISSHMQNEMGCNIYTKTQFFLILLFLIN